MTNEVELRRATAADATLVTSIVRAAYELYVPRIGREPEPMGVDYRALAERASVWIASRSGVAVGVLVTRPMSDHLLVENVAVLPAEQGRGVGAALLERAEQDAREAGLTELRLYTNEAMVENLTYYPRRGFTETHRATQDGYARVFFTKQLPGPGNSGPWGTRRA